MYWGIGHDQASQDSVPTCDMDPALPRSHSSLFCENAKTTTVLAADVSHCWSSAASLKLPDQIFLISVIHHLQDSKPGTSVREFKHTIQHRQMCCTHAVVVGTAVTGNKIMDRGDTPLEIILHGKPKFIFQGHYVGFSMSSVSACQQLAIPATTDSRVCAACNRGQMNSLSVASPFFPCIPC